MALIDNPDISPIRAEIKTSEQALAWVTVLVQEMQLWRSKCDTVQMVSDRQKALWTFLQKQGQVIGALKALRLCGLIGDQAYREYCQRAINSLVPTVTNL
jgi:hypothetical protein